MSEVITLRGAVLSKFKTIGNFADKAGWSRNKASRIINEKQVPTVEDIITAADALEIHSQHDFMQIFLPTASTKWTA